MYRIRGRTVRVVTLSGWWSDRHGIYTSYFRSFVLSVSGRYTCLWQVFFSVEVVFAYLPILIFFFFFTNNFRSHFCFFSIQSTRGNCARFRFVIQSIVVGYREKIIIATFSSFRRIRLSSLSKSHNYSKIQSATAWKRATVKYHDIIIIIIPNIRYYTLYAVPTIVAIV